jgi:hypothetical protein
MVSAQGQKRMDQRFEEGLAWARWAVSRWASFPVNQEPRPLLLIGPDLLVEGGFSTGEAKAASIEGRYELAASVPQSVRAALARRSKGTTPLRSVPALQITEATRSATEFRTDRGRVRLPAWRLTCSSTNGPIWLLDPELEGARWRPPEDGLIPRPELPSPPGDLGARSDLHEDGVTLTVHVLGAVLQLERYTGGHIIESPQAIAVVPIGEDIGPSAPFRTLAGHMHKITVRLHEPLGARVHVDLHGNPVEVRSTPP